MNASTQSPAGSRSWASVQFERRAKVHVFVALAADLSIYYIHTRKRIKSVFTSQTVLGARAPVRTFESAQAA